VENEGSDSTNDLGSPQIDASEAFPEAGITALGVLQGRGVSDMGQSSFYLLLLARLIFAQAHQSMLCLVDLTSSDRVPRRLGSQVCSNEEGDGPNPLEDEWKTPGPIPVDGDGGSNNTGGKEDASTPAHADICRHVRSEDGRDDFRRIGSGQSLGGKFLLSTSRTNAQMSETD
jgi:hypothetical protein